MACFLAPATAAIITTSIKKKIAPKYHLEWLNTMLWGGVIMLAVEHITHGEVVLYPPFLTAMQNPADIPVMLQEIAIIGGAMTITIIAVWTIMILVANKATKIHEKKIQIVTT
ncbi:hypothetical protein KJ980_03040 [Patescibacteria group bacterium]|nr:hypothetical protein [Patescibacteria group bacterium]MBU4017232.1 hypothetical protein [Patescibacteria group bacterium]MBU4098602.1 hypothetical protein [Patescibacteria group bacterium]